MTEAANPVSTALVLAAGRGGRLGQEIPKPLYPVLGVPLLARTLFTLRKAGVEKAYVVIGYQGSNVRLGVERIKRLDMDIEWVRNDRWEEPNGVSVLAAEDQISAPFILTMSDHLFDAQAVTRLIDGAATLDAVDLVVDRNISAVNDLDDATKVKLQGDRIVEIGKSLSDFDVIDTGVFLASPELFEALKSSGGLEGPSLSDGVRRLAGEGRVRAVDGSDLEWQDVDTLSDVDAATRMLMSRWPKAGDGPVAKRINRPISTRISRWLVNTPITPNQISVGTLVISLFSAWFAAEGGYFAWLMSGLLFQFASILDGSDGEVAFLTFQSSHRGEWVDTICDNVSYVAFLVGLTIGAFNQGLAPFYFWGGIVGIGATILSLGNINLYLARQKKSGSALSVPYSYKEGTGLVHRILRSFSALGRRDSFSFLAFMLAVIGLLPLALPLFGVGAALL
ncbi:MAG: NTP transferase domain-containing protein, partial [Longimicrobiales bacterium]